MKERNKNRRPENVAVSISMSRDLKARAEKIAKERGLNNFRLSSGS